MEPTKVTNVWLVVAQDIDSKVVYIFKGITNECKALLRNATSIIGHNFIHYDYRVIERFAPGTIDPVKVIDTLTLSKLLKYKLDDGEGHSLEAWGNRFLLPKHASPDFSKYSEQMVEYCVQDVEINAKLYEYLMTYLGRPEFSKAVAEEMAMTWVCLDMHLNGFKYDKKGADELLKALEESLAILDEEIIKCFPPRLVAVREIIPKATKHGTISKSNLPRDWTDYTMLAVGCPFTLVRSVCFNPASTSQVVQRLDSAGWKPTELTKSGRSYKVNEVNLATLPDTAPEGAKKLVERALIAARVRTLKEWEGSYEPNGERIHGTFNTIGTWPGRMSHGKPNMGNIATKKSIKYKTAYLKSLATDLGARMRSFWICPGDAWLVGTDMEAAHVRLFAHYIDDKEFTQAVVSGDKKKGTDVHSLGAGIFKHLGCDRDLHKTFIFSFFNGAAAPKVSEIFNCSIGEAQRALALYQERYPGLAKLRQELIPTYARQGFFPGLDGREVIYTEEHGMFAGMLQSGEACVMKHANLLWRKKLYEQGIAFKQVNLVHDEFVTEVLGEEATAKRVGQIQADAIRDIGNYLNLRCPLAGEYKVGKTWLEVH